MRPSSAAKNASLFIGVNFENNPDGNWDAFVDDVVCTPGG